MDTPSRQWSYRNLDQPAIVVLLTDEQAADRLERKDRTYTLEPLFDWRLVLLEGTPS